MFFKGGPVHKLFDCFPKQKQKLNPLDIPYLQVS